MPRPKVSRPTYSLAKRGEFWCVQWWEAATGRSRRVSCGTADESQARRFLAEWQAGLDAKTIPQTPTIGMIIDGYLEDRMPRVSSQTISYCCRELRKHLTDLPVDLLTKEVIRRYTADRRAARAGLRGRPISNGTLIRELGTLRAALTWAVRERWITAAPHVERPRAPQPRQQWLTRDEAARLMEATQAPHMKVFMALALYTAARAGALLELTWDRVDMEAGTIDLGEGRGKKRRAKVPIVDSLRSVLEPAAAVATCQFVIEYGSRPVASIKTGFHAAVRRAGLVGVTPHVLRHTAATWMVQRNVPLPMISAWLGNSVQMVERVYGHHSPEWLQQAARALSP